MNTKFVIVMVALLTASGCRQIERITTTRSERVDSVNVSVPLSGHVLDVPVITADTIFVEDDRVRVTIIPLPDLDVSDDPEGMSGIGSIESDMQNDDRSSTTRYRVIAEVKPDTQQVKVAEKTITEKTETVKYERKIPWWGTTLIGGLIMLVIILLVARRLK